MHEKVEGVVKHIGVKKAGPKVAGRRFLFSAKEDQVQAFDRRFALRKSFGNLEWTCIKH